MALRLSGVTRIFRPAHGDAVPVLEPIDLEVGRGEFLAVLGPSGCGKSTLLRIVAGLDRPTAGTIGWLEQGTTGEAEEARSIAYVFQDAHLLPWRSVLRNVTLPLELAGGGRAEAESIARATLEQVGLEEAVDRYPAELSGGMRMRVSLARALVVRPRLLLLDEPFAALDEITRQELDDQLRTLWLANGMTVIFVTHSTNEATFLAARALVLSRRPARICLDHRIELPTDRDASLRADPRFAAQAGILYQALLSGNRR
jgi:NitT/TauT family transport system ATP-binding protein